MNHCDGIVHNLDRLFLIVTGQCNGRCALCRYWQNTPSRSLSVQTIEEKVIPLIQKYHIPVTFISGGEPTLHPHLPEIIKSLKKTGTIISLITNGSYLDRIFPQVYPYIDAYQFSLDAADEESYYRIRSLENFNQVIQSPALIRNSNPNAQIAFACVMQKKNIHQLIDIYRLASSLPIDALFFNVPEVKPFCFGRGQEVSSQTIECVSLSPEEIETLKNNLDEIIRLDSRLHLVGQRPSFFSKCIRYFQSFQSGKDREQDNLSINEEEYICPVPFDSLVFDENERLLSCFYLPFSQGFPGSIDDLANHETLRDIRKRVMNVPAFRKQHCANCLQFRY